jgi:hypothetical protein
MFHLTLEAVGEAPDLSPPGAPDLTLFGSFNDRPLLGGLD